MKNCNDAYIEEAFDKIRTDFKRRRNETGLEILDSFEEGWAEHGRLTDRQLAWLEKQLNGSWRPKGEPTLTREEDEPPVGTPQQNMVQPPSAGRGVEEVGDALMHEKLAERGKRLVDLQALHKLETLIEELKEAIQAFR